MRRLSMVLTAQANNDASGVGGDFYCQLNTVLQLAGVESTFREPPEAALSFRRMEVRRVHESEVSCSDMSKGGLERGD